MPEQASQPPGRRRLFTSKEDAQLIDLKKNRNLSWKQIEHFFPERSIGTLQVHYGMKSKTTGIVQKKRRL